MCSQTCDDGKRSIVMAETARSFPVVREAVASFADRAHFRRAVSSLLAAGFRHEDVSVLASHQPLTAAEGEPREFVAAGLSDELKYIAPLTVAGIVLVSGGPITATVAALDAAGLGGAAVKEHLHNLTGAPHHADIEAALNV